MPDSSTDLRDKFILGINLDRCRVILEPYLVFVCGGPVDITKTENYSIRNMFMNSSGAVSNSEFILAENFKDWQDGYDDLAAFENDIANISSLVTVILESAGSIAELGLFYANENIRSKLITVLHSSHYESKSFIKFGLLNPLESLDERFVLPFKIDPSNIEKIDPKEVHDIVKEIDELCLSTPKSEKFDKYHRGHKIFLTFQIIDMFLALTKQEISAYLLKLDVSMTSGELTSCLFILQKFNLIGSKKRSSQTFFFAKIDATIRIDLKPSIGKARIDTSAIKIEVSQFFREAAKRNRSHKNRVRVIEDINKGAKA
ncbi:retron St85 family effector protein [Kiloniella sp.]|uniref:retron St85 family effector protein n=1 Tax=Kiloniella sp. TaxID=1938587 RepID=UPI003A8FBB5D